MTAPKSTVARDGFDHPGSTGGGSQAPSRGRDRAYPAPDVSAATSPVAEESAFPAGRERGTTGTDAALSTASGASVGSPPYAEVRRLANEGRFKDAADAWALHLWWREDAASTLWMTCPLAADRPRRQVAAEKARADLRVFTEAMWADPSAAMGQLIATWPAEESV